MDKLNDVKATLAGLHLRDVGLVPADPGRQCLLRQSGLLSSAYEIVAQRPVRLSAEGPASPQGAGKRANGD